jgi:3-methyladenine DNA glycosylase Tag
VGLLVRHLSLRPTRVYASLQNIGVVNDHIHGCFRAADYIEPQTN